MELTLTARQGRRNKWRWYIHTHSGKNLCMGTGSFGSSEDALAAGRIVVQGEYDEETRPKRGFFSWLAGD